MISNKQIIDYLTSKTVNASFIDKLKIKYRPLFCPFDMLLSYVEDKSSVFDIGCGSGQFCSLVARFTDAKKIEGIEINETLVKNAREVTREFQQKKEIAFSVFDGKTLPQSMKNYELVYLIDVIHHIPQYQQESFIEEIFSKMAKGTTLIFKDVDAAHPFVFFNKIHDIIFSGEIGREIQFQFAKHLLKNAGFTIKESFRKTVFVFPYYFIICQK
jgi:2-polyprenyl-3-methyl-5-hydroxy-6-metoxy-1,4-benzoquinol methylase